ncbi:MAG: 5-formyltetrahydrofolate cyclo-ligase [Treponema sp.]|nr:5-formyltetrahydrofolate cyclo-ligase [Treponema sp.]
MEKREVRNFIKNQILAHEGELGELSNGICAKILSSEEFNSASLIFSYMPMPDEVNLLPLVEEIFAAGKKLALPRIDEAAGTMDFYLFKSLADFKTGTSQGYFGIQEPNSSAEKIDTAFVKEKALILVPGRAFSLNGGRLGRGKGFYDSYLAKIVSLENFSFAGVAFPFQILEDIPLDKRDISVQKIFF